MVREACITVAYMSQELHHKVDHFCEMVLPTLVNLIPNTAKVMASAGVVAIRFMVQNTHHHRLVPLLTREMASKSREIRRTLCEFLDQLVHTWPTHSMEKHAALIAEALRKGITDADPEARAFARKYVARPQPVGATPGARTPRSSASLSLSVAGRTGASRTTSGRRRTGSSTRSTPATGRYCRARLAP